MCRLAFRQPLRSCSFAARRGRTASGFRSSRADLTMTARGGGRMRLGRRRPPLSAHEAKVETNGPARVHPCPRTDPHGEARAQLRLCVGGAVAAHA